MSERGSQGTDFAAGAESFNAEIDAGDRERERRALGEFRVALQRLDELTEDRGPVRASERRLQAFQDELARLRLGGRPVVAGAAEASATALRALGSLSPGVVGEVREMLSGQMAPEPPRAHAMIDRLNQLEAAATRYAQAANNQLLTGMHRLANDPSAAAFRRDMDRLVQEAGAIARDSGIIQQLAGQARVQWAKALVIQRDSAPKP